MAPKKTGMTTSTPAVASNNPVSFRNIVDSSGPSSIEESSLIIRTEVSGELAVGNLQTKPNKKFTTLDLLFQAIEVVGVPRKGASYIAILKWITNNKENLVIGRLKANLKKAIIKSLENGVLKRATISKNAIGLQGYFMLNKDTLKNIQGKATSVTAPKAKNPPALKDKNAPAAQAKNALTQKAKNELAPKAKIVPAPKAKNVSVPKTKKATVPKTKNETKAKVAAKNADVPNAKNAALAKAKKVPVANNAPVPKANNAPVPKAKNEPVPKANNAPVPKAKNTRVKKFKNALATKAKNSLDSISKNAPLRKAKTVMSLEPESYTNSTLELGSAIGSISEHLITTRENEIASTSEFHGATMSKLKAKVASKSKPKTKATVSEEILEETKPISKPKIARTKAKGIAEEIVLKEAEMMEAKQVPEKMKNKVALKQTKNSIPRAKRLYSSRMNQMPNMSRKDLSDSELTVKPNNRKSLKSYSSDTEIDGVQREKANKTVKSKLKIGNTKKLATEMSEEAPSKPKVNKKQKAKNAA